jgi:anti-sigma B factor antagonist
MSFTYNLNQTEPIVMITLYGELIERNQSQLMLDQINALCEEGKSKVVMDLSELKYMNSTGLNVLLNVLTKTRKSGGDVALCGISKKVQELLLITKLSSVFTVTETADEAAARLNS